MICNLPLQLPTAEPRFPFLLLTDFLSKYFGHSMRHILSHHATCSSQSVWSFLSHTHFHTNKSSGWHSQPLPPVRYTNRFSCSFIISSYTKNLLVHFDHIAIQRLTLSSFFACQLCTLPKCHHLLVSGITVQTYVHKFYVPSKSSAAWTLFLETSTADP